MAELDIWMGDERVGVLDGRDRRNLAVVYDDGWVEDPRATPLSVSMPLAARRHSGARVAAYLWGLLPDNDRVLARWATAYQCPATDVFGLLEGVGADVAGAARFLPPGLSPTERAAGRIEPLTEADVADLLRAIRVDTTAWHPGARGRWSLAGAQAKIALAQDERTGRWGIPWGMAPTTHIIKPAIAGLDHHDLNEHLCLATAARLGLHVAESRVRRFAGEQALVVTRYDRLRRDGAVTRIHQEDCCQALGVHPERKYQADGGPGIEDVATMLREVEIRSADADITALVDAAAFNWLVLGTDAHAKNTSLLLSGRQVRLAPLYDIASAAPYGDHPRKLRLAQKVGGEYRPTVIGPRHWDRLARAVRADPDRLHARIVGLADRLPDTLEAAIAEVELGAVERRAAHRMLDAVSAWTAACRSKMVAS
jgi:serine/threonine-protein kinase HipA